MKRKLPIVSLGILLFLVLLSFLGPLLYPQDPFTFHKELILQGPSFAHPLGTDRLGRDLLARIMQGGQVSLLIGVGSAVIASLIGIIMGVSAEGLIVLINRRMQDLTAGGRGIQVGKRLLDTCNHALLPLAQPDTRIIVLLIRLIRTVRIAEL